MKILSRPKGNAEEYGRWAVNAYLGCPNQCRYCYLQTGPGAKTLGGHEARLKAGVRSAAHAYHLAMSEIIQNEEQSQDFWLTMLRQPQTAEATAVLFYICFQMYQTAMRYYEAVFPLLFHGGGKDDPLRDALTGEVGTINSVMKYQGYTDPQQVYDANLPIILDTLNTMTKEAKEIEKMNAKIKRK